MNITQYNGLVICELSPNGGLLGSDLTAPDLIGEVYNANPDLIVVPVSRLAPGFLDLSTFDEVSKTEWASTADVKRLYATASIVSAERIVFNIKGNDYRLIVSADFEKGIVWIKWLGTHKAYVRIDVKEIDHGN